MHSITRLNWILWRQNIAIIFLIILFLPLSSLAADLAPDMRAHLYAWCVSNPNLTPHEDFTMGVDITNEGNLGSDPTTLQAYLSSNSMISTGDTKIGREFPVSSLDPSGWENVVTSLTAPGAEGTYYVGACVAPVPDEVATANNCSEGYEITVAGDPDLTVINPSVTDTSLTQSQEYTITVTAKNIGTVPAPATSIRFYLSTDATIKTTDTRLSSDTYYGVSALGPGMINTITTDYLYAPWETGTYYVGACVNTVGGEVDFDNNCSSGVLIEVSQAMPDLIVSGIGVSIEPFPLTTGQFFNIHAMVANIGTQLSDRETTLRYYLSSNAVISTHDTELATDSLGTLDAGGNILKIASVQAPFRPLTYWVGACVDAVDNESNKNNQCSNAYLINVNKGPFPWTMYLPAITAGGIEN